MESLPFSWQTFRARGVEWLFDADGWRYRFERWPLNLPPDRRDCVFAFADMRRTVLFIGVAGKLREQVFSHARLRDAINAGAVEIWAHTPGREDPFTATDVRARLEHAVRPALNGRAGPPRRARPALIGVEAI
ncbi:MAG: hypothetical protein AAFR16_04795 [Pseudomonadota bacterium]